MFWHLILLQEKKITGMTEQKLMQPEMKIRVEVLLVYVPAKHRECLPRVFSLMLIQMRILTRRKHDLQLGHKDTHQVFEDTPYLACLLDLRRRVLQKTAHPLGDLIDLRLGIDECHNLIVE